MRDLSPGLFACSVLNCSGPGDNFTFNAGNATAANFGPGGGPFYGSDGFFGAFAERFSPARWSLTAAAVPEAGTLPLLLVGCLLLGVVRRNPGRKN